MYTVASPDPNPRGGGQLPNPNECNSTLTSGANNIYPYPYINVNDRGHRFRSGSPLTNYSHAAADKLLKFSQPQFHLNENLPVDRRVF